MKGSSEMSNEVIRMLTRIPREIILYRLLLLHSKRETKFDKSRDCDIIDKCSSYEKNGFSLKVMGADGLNEQNVRR